LEYFEKMIIFTLSRVSLFLDNRPFAFIILIYGLLKFIIREGGIKKK